MFTIEFIILPVQYGQYEMPMLWAEDKLFVANPLKLKTGGDMWYEIHNTIGVLGESFTIFFTRTVSLSHDQC